ncbi:MAG: phosphatase PAP2 family protein [Cellvibrionales bacterium]|nr:phosphatase PAP2 family protein [Cellvibrionales bacterium]
MKILARCWGNFREENQFYHNTPFYHCPKFALFLVIATLLGSIKAFMLYQMVGSHGFFAPINSMSWHLPEHLIQILNTFGDTVFVLLLVPVIGRFDQRFIYLVFVAAIFTAIVVHTNKALFGALRPPAVLPEGTYFLTGHTLKQGSFPSGHSATIFVCFAVLSIKYTQLWLRVLFYLAAAIIAISRVWSSAHWPLDVIAGAVVGIFCTWLAYLFCRKYPQGLTLKAQTGFLTLLIINMLLAFFHDTGYSMVQWLVWITSVLCLLLTLLHYLKKPKLAV